MGTENFVDVDGYKVGAVDAASAARLAGQGLDLRTVDLNGDRFPGWLQAVARGFLDGERTDEQVAASRERSGYRRMTGVYDATGVAPEVPVGTIASWVGRLSIPGDRDIPASAISAVTVAPTHRRRGIARALLEGELRVAHDAGLPMAMLTVSESTLYGRYGFAPAAASGDWRIDVKRASWIGPVPEGRLDFVSRERARELLAPLHERVRQTRPGEVDIEAGMWDSIAGTRPDAENAAAKRAAQYTDADGEVRGVVVYSPKENFDDYTKSTVSIGYLLAETDDAYAALWRFFIEMDLIGEVRATEQAVDEPLLWMLSDQRAATVRITDHQYLRILDVPAALEARTFGAPGSLVLEVNDPLDLAGGRFLVEVGDDLRAQVTVLGADVAPEGAVVVRLGIAELSAVYLGGVSLATLAIAGRVTATDVTAAARVFGWHVAPRLSIWY